MVSVSELRDWLDTAKSGEKRVYYLGFLAVDRVVTEMVDGKLRDRLLEPANTIGELMQWAYEDGKVTLWQERIGEFEYKYWARRL
jgi:hypothetical protein